MKSYLNIKEVADFLRVSESTVERWQRQGVLPPFYQITPRSERFWNPKELESMIKNSRRAA